MPGDRMVTLTKFANPIEAELAKNRLLDEGITAHLLGDTGGNPFAGVGGLFGTMSLMVAEADVVRASRVLAQAGPEGLPDEENENSTAIKAPEWARADAGEEDDPEAQYRAADLEVQAAKPMRKEQRTRAGDSEAPPRGVKGKTGAEEQQEDADLNVAWKPDDYAARAWKAAVIGLMLVPFGLAIFLGIAVLVYSVYLLVRLVFMDEELSTAGMRKLYVALTIDSMALMTLALIFWRTLR